jgi:chromosome segregation ATPase
MWAQLREVHALREFHYEMTVGKHKLEGQLAEAGKDRQRLEGELRAATQETEGLQAQLAEAGKDRQRLEGELRAATEQTQRLEAHLTEAAEEQQRLDALLIDAAQETQRLKREITERDAKVERLQVSMDAKDLRIDRLEDDLREIQSSLGWTLLSAYTRAKNRWLPPGSRLRALHNAIVSGVKLGLSQGFAALFRKVAARLRRQRE